MAKCVTTSKFGRFFLFLYANPVIEGRKHMLCLGPMTQRLYECGRPTQRIIFVSRWSSPRDRPPFPPLGTVIVRLNLHSEKSNDSAREKEADSSRFLSYFYFPFLYPPFHRTTTNLGTLMAPTGLNCIPPTVALKHSSLKMTSLCWGLPLWPDLCFRVT